MSGQLSFSAPPRFKPNRRIRVALRLEDWPAEDRRCWNAAFARGGLFEDQGAGSHLCSRTRVSLLNAHGRWLGVLARYDPEALALSAADRTTPERVRLFATVLRRQTADARSRVKSGTFEVPSVCSRQRWTQAGC